MTPDRSPVRIHSVDVLRGLFACSVMYCHYSYYWPLQLPAVMVGTAQKLGVYAVEGFSFSAGSVSIGPIASGRPTRYAM